MTDWWRALEEELERRGIDAPDPWASVGVSSEQSVLTPDQRAFLEQVASTSVHGLDDDLQDDSTSIDDSTQIRESTRFTDPGR